MHTTRFTIAILGFLVCPLAIANEDRLTNLRDMLAEALYEEHPGQRLDELIASGVSHTDSKEILSRLNRALSTCMLDAIREYSSEKSLDFGDQLDLLEVDLKDGVAGRYFSSLDQVRLKQILYPCSIAAGQAAGLKAPDSVD